MTYSFLTLKPRHHTESSEGTSTIVLLLPKHALCASHVSETGCLRRGGEDHRIWTFWDFQNSILEPKTSLAVRGQAGGWVGHRDPARKPRPRRVGAGALPFTPLMVGPGPAVARGRIVGRGPKPPQGDPLGVGAPTTNCLPNTPSE